jgi:hypothetical protein
MSRIFRYLAVVGLTLTIGCGSAHAQWRDNSDDLPKDDGDSTTSTLQTAAIVCVVLAVVGGVAAYVIHKKSVASNKVSFQMKDRTDTSKNVLTLKATDPLLIRTDEAPLVLRDRQEALRMKPVFDVVSRNAGGRTDQLVMAGVRLSF